MGRRRQGREGALHALYLADAAPSVVKKAFAWAVEIDDKATREFSRDIFEGVLHKSDELNEKISGISSNWTLPRMATVDRCILRLAAYELLYHGETPVKVIIDEYIEIARKYSLEDSTSFVNGILDKLKDLRPA